MAEKTQFACCAAGLVEECIIYVIFHQNNIRLHKIASDV
jgi:hypothetical protein